jgi:Phage integrase, N-terminal SAM-like domain
MDLRRKPNGRWEVRWREGARRRGRTFDRKGDAQNYMAWLRRRQQLGQAAVPDDVPLGVFIETYWTLHAKPNLSPATKELYRRVWSKHILPRLGNYGVRELTPKRLTRFRAELERAGVGAATVVKAMTIVQSILSFAVSEELVEYNAAAGVPKPHYKREREPHIFLPPEVEAIRAQLELRDRTLVSVLAYSGPRPEEVVPPRLARHRRARHPLPGHQASPHPAGAAAEAAGRRSHRVVPRVRTADGHATRVPRARRQVLEPGRLAQLAQARLAGRTRAAASRSQESDASEARLCAERHSAPRPSLELRDAARVRGRAAHADRPRGRHERPDDRAPLRRCDRQLGRQTAPCRDLNSGRQKGLHPGSASN